MILPVISRLDRYLDRMDAGASSSPGSLLFVFDEATQDLFPLLTFLVTLAETLKGSGATPSADFSARFGLEFLLGPYGLHPLIHFFNRLLQRLSTEVLRGDILFVKSLDITDALNVYTAPLLSLLLHFRSNTHRSHYDPPGFSALQEALKNHHNYFGVWS